MAGPHFRLLAVNVFLHSSTYFPCETFNLKALYLSLFVLPMGRSSTPDKGRSTNGAADPPSRSQSYYTLASHINDNTLLPPTQINTLSTAAGKKTVMGDATSTSSPLSSVLSSPVTSAKSQGPSLSLEADPVAPSSDEAAAAAAALQTTSPTAASITAPEMREDQASKQINKRKPEEHAAEDDERPKRRKVATTGIVETVQSAPVEAEALDEATVGVEATDEGSTSSADELAESKKSPSKPKPKAKAASKKKAAPSHRGPPACPECKRRKV